MAGAALQESCCSDGVSLPSSGTYLQHSIAAQEELWGCTRPLCPHPFLVPLLLLSAQVGVRRSAPRIGSQCWEWADPQVRLQPLNLGVWQGSEGSP